MIINLKNKMNKKIAISLSVIAAVAAFAVYGTTAFFSDTETSTGNTFTAGSVDLKIDSTATYNGEPVAAATWELKDLVPTADKFFNFADIKPGDSGENTISLHVFDNDAWACAMVSNLVNADNTLTEPESSVDPNGLASGELQDNIYLTIWRDNGDADEYDQCDNKWEDGEDILVDNKTIDDSNGVWPLFAPGVGAGEPLKGDETACLGVSWNVPPEVGNEIQTDSVTGDISFYVEQARNNPNFRCPEPVCEYSVEPTGKPYSGLYGSTVTPVTITKTDCNTVTALRIDSAQSFGSGGWAGWSCIEPGYPNVVGGGIVGPGAVAIAQGPAEYGAPAIDGFNYPVYPHYTFNGGSNTPGGEEGWVVRAGSPVPTGIYALCAN